MRLPNPYAHARPAVRANTADDHELAVLHDGGLYRHQRMAEPPPVSGIGRSSPRRCRSPVLRLAMPVPAPPTLA